MTRLTCSLILAALVAGCGPEAPPETWDPTQVEASIPRVVDALLARDPDGALAAIEDLRARGNAPAGLEHYEGMAHADAGRNEDALDAFERELAARPGNGEAHMLAADMLTTMGRLAEARDHLARAAEHGADPVYSNLLRGRLALLSSDDELARRAFQDYLTGDRYSTRAAEAHHALAQIATRQGRTAEAGMHAATSTKLEEVAQFLNLYGDRVREDPSDAEATLGIGMIYLDLFNGMGRDPELASQAEAAFKGALRLQPDNLKALLNLAFLRSIEERYDEAIALLDEAVALDPEFATAHLNRGFIARQQRDLDLAVARFAAAAQFSEDPVERARALYELAVTQEELGRAAEALAAYEQVVALQPDPPPEILERMDRLRQQVEAAAGEG